MREREYTGEGFYLTYREQEDGLVITGFHGRVHRLPLPDEIEGIPVVGIDRKVFLSKKTLQEVVLPKKIREIGDWAFAYCSQLEKVLVGRGEISMGKAVFLDCGKLKEIGAGQTGRLLAGAVTMLDAEYLLNPGEAGSSEWLKMWDARLEAILAEEDMEDYHRQVLCGEEDYGSTDVEAFVQEKRKKKVRLAFLRLQNDVGLAEADRERLSEYVRSHTKGKESQESWLVVLQDCPYDREVIQLFLDLGCADEGNMQGILADIGDQYPEMKAMFLRHQDQTWGYGDFFAGLEL